MVKVALVSGTYSAFDDWSYIIDAAGEAKPSQSAIFPEVSKFTRVCAYDRPGTERVNGTLIPSTPVSQPTAAQNGATDLEVLLTTAKVSGLVLPNRNAYVLHSLARPSRWR
jgi:hypothetical protein